MVEMETQSEPVRALDTLPMARPRRRGRRYYKSGFGFYALRTTLRALGPRVIDKRTHVGKQLAAWRVALVSDLGGEDVLSTQARTLVEIILRQKLLLDSIDAWLLTQRSLVNQLKRALLPVVRERQQLADALARYLAQLGLERQARDVDLAAHSPAILQLVPDPYAPRRQRRRRSLPDDRRRPRGEEPSL